MSLSAFIQREAQSSPPTVIPPWWWWYDLVSCSQRLAEAHLLVGRCSLDVYCTNR